jgi:hypothetical protein
MLEFTFMFLLTIHEIQNKTQFILRVKSVGHTYNEGTVHLNEKQLDSCRI